MCESMSNSQDRNSKILSRVFCLKTENWIFKIVLFLFLKKSEMLSVNLKKKQWYFTKFSVLIFLAEVFGNSKTIADWILIQFNHKNILGIQQSCWLVGLGSACVWNGCWLSSLLCWSANSNLWKNCVRKGIVRHSLKLLQCSIY